MTLLSWETLYRDVLPTRTPGILFQRLHEISSPTVVVTGCQRSGTSWIRKLITEGLDDAIGPKELEGCNYLVAEYTLGNDGSACLVLQATFANTDTSSMVRLPEQTPLLWVIRNPFSVCRSLVYNWDNLELEYAYRFGAMPQPADLEPEGQRWQAAIQIYTQSMEAGLRLFELRPESTRLLVYDDFIHDVAGGLDRLSSFLNRPLRLPVEHQARLGPSRKQLELDPSFRKQIADRCLGPFEELQRTAALAGCLLTESGIHG